MSIFSASVFTNLNSKYSAIKKIEVKQIKDNLDYSKLIKKTNENNVDKLINNFLGNNTSEYCNLLTVSNKNKSFSSSLQINSERAIISNQTLIKQKAKNVVSDIFNHQTLINNVVLNNKKKLSALTYKQREEIRSLKSEIKINKSILSEGNDFKFKNGTTNLFQNNCNVNLKSGISDFKKSQNNFFLKLKAFAGTSTAIAIATTAIAAAEWCVPFWGWVAAGFTTAAAIADWVAAGVSWAAYAQIENVYSNLIGALSASVSAGNALSSDVITLVSNIKDYSDLLTGKVSAIRVALIPDLCVNDYDLWAYPGDSLVIAAVDVALWVFDSVMAGIGIYSTIAYYE